MNNVINFYEKIKTNKIIVTDEILEYYGEQFQQSDEKANGYTFLQYVEIILQRQSVDVKILEKRKQKKVY